MEAEIPLLRSQRYIICLYPQQPGKPSSHPHTFFLQDTFY
jgi:hypothetical protein